MKCKTSDRGCPYHACMSDDCQKRFMLDSLIHFGPGKCEQETVINSGGSRGWGITDALEKTSEKQ